MTTKTPSVRNCRCRYAAAPSCTAPAISCIFVGALAGGEHLLDQRGREAERDQRDDRDDDDVGQVAAAQGQLAAAGGAG